MAADFYAVDTVERRVFNSGGSNLAVLLSRYHTGKLRSVLRDWTAHGDPAGLYTVTAPLSATQANKEPLKGGYSPRTR